MAVNIKNFVAKGSMNFGTAAEPNMKVLWQAEFECDTVADLAVLNPLDANFFYPDVMLMVPSTAHIIEGNKNYAMKSDGTWAIQEDPIFSGIYTKSEIDEMFSDVDNIQIAQAAEILDLQLEDATINSHIVNMINEGCKNIANLTGNTRTENGVTMTIEPDRSVTLSGVSTQYYAFRIIGDQAGTDYQYGVPIPRGTYVLTGIDLNASATTSRYILGIRTASDVARTSTSIYTSPYEFTVDNDTTRIDLSIYTSTGASFNNPLAHYYPMISEKWKWELTQDYVPYSPSNAELAKMILGY